VSTHLKLDMTIKPIPIGIRSNHIRFDGET
jgi:hypothetical protein